MNVPRRIRIDLQTPAEAAIRAAVDAVEALPPDVRLTEAVKLLGAAREKVSDYVDATQPVPWEVALEALRPQIEALCEKHGPERAAEMIGEVFRAHGSNVSVTYQKTGPS